MTNPHTLLVFATEQEAAATRNILPPHHDILITGMGCHNVKVKLTDQLNAYDYDIIINIGIVGAMRDEFPMGSYVPIKCIYHEHEAEPIGIAPTGFSLLTVEAPLYVTRPAFDLVDMEAYMVASLCKQANKTLHFIKVVSDIVSQHSSAHIRERLPVLSQILSTHIHERLQK